MDGEAKWLYVVIDVESELLLEINVTSRRGTDAGVVFLKSLTELHGTDAPNFSSRCDVTARRPQSTRPKSRYKNT
jgi:transposase-like protein